MKQSRDVVARHPFGDDGGSVAASVVQAVADASGVGQTELDPLEYAVPVEALNRVCADEGTTVRFEYEDRLVEVSGDAVSVYEPVSDEPAVALDD